MPETRPLRPEPSKRTGAARCRPEFRLLLCSTKSSLWETDANRPPLPEHQGPATPRGDRFKHLSNWWRCAAVAAAEQDSRGLIDGVAVSGANGCSCPPVPALPSPVADRQRCGGAKPVDYTSHATCMNPAHRWLRQATAPYAAGVCRRFLPVASSVAPNRCASLKAQGLITGNHTAELAEAALQKCWAWDGGRSNVLHPSLAAFEVKPAISATTPFAYARSSVKDNLCGFSYAATAASGAITAAGPRRAGGHVSTGNGVPPSSGVNSSTTTASSAQRVISCRSTPTPWPTGTSTVPCACATCSPAPVPPRSSSRLARMKCA